MNKEIRILLIIAIIGFLSEIIYVYIKNVFEMSSRHNLDIDKEKIQDIISNDFKINKIPIFILDICNRLLISSSRFIFIKYTSSLKLGEDYSNNKFNVPKFIAKIFVMYNY